MKTKILFKQLGENWTTSRDAVAVWEDGMLSAEQLAKEIPVCVSMDNDMLVTKGLYEIREIDLPEGVGERSRDFYQIRKFEVLHSLGMDADACRKVLDVFWRLVDALPRFRFSFLKDFVASKPRKLKWKSIQEALVSGQDLSADQMRDLEWRMGYCR